MSDLDFLIKIGVIVQIKEHIFLINLNSCWSINYEWESAISDYDKIRLNNITIEKSRNKVLLRISLVRIILSHYLNYPPYGIEFKKNEYGKPYIVNPVVNLKFNISHSDHYIIVMIDKYREVGVDIETTRSLRRRNFQGFESLYSKIERDRYNGLPVQDQLEMFCQTWVIKEAALKALGSGLTVALKNISIVFFNDLELFLLPETLKVKIQFIQHEDNYIGIAYHEEKK